jgi:glycosyltransferase involved in cell wall biosynthesis
MNKPLLTVCLLSYNQAEYIREAIDTILAQEVTFSWELVIADDCSTDGTQKILREYEKKFPKLIKLILQEKNVGPEANWLDLMEYPKSKYVLYAEGDDYFTDTQKLQKQVDFLEKHSDYALCFHPVKVVYQDGSKPDGIFPSPDQRFNKDVLELGDLLGNNFLQTNSVMYRWRFVKENIKDIWPYGISPGDWLLHILHAEKGTIGFMPTPMSVYRKHPRGLWWDAEHNKDQFWRKYGIAWLGFHAELLKLYGSNPAYRPIVESSIINLLNSLQDVDDLFSKAVAALPQTGEVYIHNLRKEVQELHKHADEQAKIIKHYVGLSQDLENRLKHVERRNAELETKLLVKLSGAVKRRTKWLKG